jgi:hypothetical protein
MKKYIVLFILLIYQNIDYSYGQSNFLNIGNVEKVRNQELCHSHQSEEIRKKSDLILKPSLVGSVGAGSDYVLKPSTLMAKINGEFYRYIQINFNSNFTNSQFEELNLDLEGAIFKKDVLAKIYVNSFEYELLKSKNADIEIIIADVEKYYSNENKFKKSLKVVPQNENLLLKDSNGIRYGSYNGYFTPDEIYQLLDEYIVKYPEIFAKIKIGETFEKNPIYVYRFGREFFGTGNYYPVTMIISTHHAREVGSPFTQVNYILNLFDRYENNDAKAIYFAQNKTVYFLPMLNPDGYLYNIKTNPNSGGFWRKNRFQINDSTYGIDLNRNYGPLEYWDSPNNGSSINPRQDTYRGETPFSELETSALKNFVQGKNIKILIDMHTYGGTYLNPISALAITTLDSNLYNSIGLDYYLSNKYVFGFDFDVYGYSTRGNSEDFFYTTDGSFDKMLSMCNELGSYIEGFYPTIDTTAKTAVSNFSFFDKMILASNTYLHPSSLDLVEKDGQFKLKLTYKNLGIKTSNTIYFEIKPLYYRLQIDQPVQNIYDLMPGKSQDFYFDFMQIMPIQNGVNYKFEVTTYYDNLIIKDTLETTLFKYESMKLADITNFEKNWELDFSWLWNYDIQNQIVTLKSNDAPAYPLDTITYAEYTGNIDLTNLESAYLHFNHKLQIETFWDMAYIQTKENQDSNWTNLTGKDMLIGLPLSKSSKITDTYGYYGNFPDFFEQNISLNNYLDNKINLRFGIISDTLLAKSGWQLRDITIRKFEKNAVSVSEKILKNQISIYPNPLFGGQKTVIQFNTAELPEVVDIQVINSNGEQIIRKTIINPERNLLIQENLNQGMYIIKIQSEHVNYFGKFVVVE